MSNEEELHVFEVCASWWVFLNVAMKTRCLLMHGDGKMMFLKVFLATWLIFETYILLPLVVVRSKSAFSFTSLLVREGLNFASSNSMKGFPAP